LGACEEKDLAAFDVGIAEPVGLVLVFDSFRDG